MITFFGDFAAHKLVNIESCFNDEIVINLEGPIAKINRRGVIRPRLSSSEMNIRQLNDKFKSVHYSVANNHILDYGKSHFNSTRKYLGESVITSQAYFPNGAHESIHLINIGSFSIGCSRSISFCIEDKRIIEKVQCHFHDKSGIKVLMIHAGVEFSKEPQPYLVRLCRKLACYCDYIIVAHSHIIGPFEEFDECKIFYGIGNFFIDMEEFQDKDDYRYPEEANRGIGIGIVSDSRFVLFDCLRRENSLYIEKKDTESMVNISGKSIEHITANYQRKRSFLAFDYPDNVDSLIGILYGYYLRFRHEVLLGTKLLLKYVRNIRSIFRKL